MSSFFYKKVLDKHAKASIIIDRWKEAKEGPDLRRRCAFLRWRIWYQNFYQKISKKVLTNRIK